MLVAMKTMGMATVTMVLAMDTAMMMEEDTATVMSIPIRRTIIIKY
jgi:hypothetical protein